METLVYPDAVRGIIALLRGVADELDIRPELFVPTDYGDYAQSPVAHIQSINATEGDIDRVQEVRITVYGFQPLASQDAAEKILTLITGDGIVTPAIENLTDSFYFDSIEQRTGPSLLDWPTDQVFPVSAQVDCRARPINL